MARQRLFPVSPSPILVNETEERQRLIAGGLLTETSPVTRRGDGSVSGVGSLAGVGASLAAGDGAFSGVGTLTGSSGASAFGVGTFAGVGALAGVGRGGKPISLDVSTSHAILDSVTDAEAAAFADLCWLDGELFSYRDATLTGTDAYDLSVLYRGLYGSAANAHASGRPFARLDPAKIARYRYPDNLIGSAIHVKFRSFNIFGLQLQDLSACTDYTLTLGPDVSVPAAVTGIALTSWTSAMVLTCNTIARATGYRWDFYKADGVTLVASWATTGPMFSYSAAQAALDGVQRSYIVRAYATNAGGAGPGQASPLFSNAAPSAVSILSTTVAGDGKSVTITNSVAPETDLAGYITYYSPTAGFNPATAGVPVFSGITTTTIFAAAGTYYFRTAPVDPWSKNPALLNLTPEGSFILTADGSIGTGGGGGGSGGGYGGGGGGRGDPP